MDDFISQFDIPGANKLAGITVKTATPTDQIVQNIKENVKLNFREIHDCSEWRERVPIAIVGGGPSLRTEIHKLKDFKYIIAAGSVHDYLVVNKIIPTWTALCDPDPIILNYIRHLPKETKFLVASQCDPMVYKHLSNRGADIIKWHLYGEDYDMGIYGENTFAVGGGCTIGTRAMIIAMCFGFFNLHLFGMDTCLNKDEHHAYEWSDATQEKIYDSQEIYFEKDGPRFEVAGYHLGQLFDLKTILKQFGNRLNITVYGDSLLSYFMELYKKRLELCIEHQKQEREK